MQKITTIVRKEWSEVFKNRIVLFTVAFLPLILTALPLITLALMGNAGGDALSGGDPLPPEMVGDSCLGLNEADCVNVYMLNLYALMFMIIPVAIPASISAYSIVGEKTSRSLEPLLATPITTAELIVGKAAAAIIPAIAATWIAFFIYLTGARLMVNDAVFARLIDPMWLIAIFVVGPLLTLLAVSIGIIVSSRVADPRVAEQLSGLVILPLMLILVGQSMGFILLDRELVLLIAGVVAVADVVLVYLSVKVFQREHILTRWK